MRYYFYGEVSFASAAKRNAAGRRIDQRAGQAGLTPETFQGLLDLFGSWPAGRADATVDGLPGLRFSYVTTDGALALSVVEDVAAAWDVFENGSAWYSYTAMPDV